jgi:hypothetical protein
MGFLQGKLLALELHTGQRLAFLVSTEAFLADLSVEEVLLASVHASGGDPFVVEEFSIRKSTSPQGIR